MPNNVHGFVYCIKDVNGKKYIGKKSLFTNRKRKFGKRESALVTDKRKKLYEIVRKESKWKDYTGSNNELNSNLKNDNTHTKEILHYAFGKKQLSYLENRELYERRVLENSEEYYNSNIGGAYYRKDV